ncbi:carboxypeptidase regulatory-like domain-containing protein [Paludisphaera borealis]|nr:carboxypeptidase regulatory-like domain-containing protein [Paludisphaera borealis]
MISKIQNALRPLLLAFGFGLAGFLAGCGSSDSAPTSMTTYPVKGKVLLADGKPLASGVVVFALPEKGMEFEAPLESDGSFALKSSYGEGAPEGSYKIRIQADLSKPADPKARGGRRSGANLAYPAKYGDETTSGLTAVVKPSANDLEPFTLAK